MAIELISLTCEKCGATLEVNKELQKCICTYCGNELLINDGTYHVEHSHKIENAYDASYEAAYGKLQAQKDFMDNMRKEKESMLREQQIEEQQIRDEIEKQKLQKKLEAEQLKDKEYSQQANRVQVLLICSTVITLGCIFLLYIVFRDQILDNNMQFLVVGSAVADLILSMLTIYKTKHLNTMLTRGVIKGVAFLCMGLATLLLGAMIYFNYNKIFSFVVLGIFIIFITTSRDKTGNSANIDMQNGINSDLNNQNNLNSINAMNNYNNRNNGGMV